MQSGRDSEALVIGDPMETQEVACSSPYSSSPLYRIRRTQSVCEAQEDILNVSPRLSQHTPNIRLDRRLRDRSCLSDAAKSSRSSCSNHMASTEAELPKTAAELIHEISTLELQVVHLERYLLSLYRTAFDQYVASSPTNTTLASGSPVECQSRPCVQDSAITLMGQRDSHSANSSNMDDHIDESQCHERMEMTKVVNSRHSEDSAPHGMEKGSDTISDPFPREGPEHDEPKSMPTHRSLASHLGASITDHVPQTPSRLSEDIIRCICAIYCKLATSPTQQMDLLASPTTSASSSSTFSPRDACDSWSPRCHYEAATSPCSFGSPKDKQGPYNGVIEVPKISIDGDRFGYASKMLNIFRSLIRRLEKIKPEKMDHDEQLAFWINIHNALVMHAFLAYGLHDNQMKSTFSIMKAAYVIGGHSVNAYVIQSLILGCQLHRSAPGLRTLWSPSIKSRKGKDTHPYALKHPEPLAHFALSMGAYSDPAVRGYSSKNVHRELKIAKEEFIQANVWVQKGRIIMPKILCYYAKDASLELPALVDMVSNCVSDSLHKSIQQCLLRRKLDKCIEWSQYKSSFRYLVHRDLAKQ